jgi:hypothetical protein
MKVTARSAGLSVVRYQFMGNDGGLRTMGLRDRNDGSCRRDGAISKDEILSVSLVAMVA